MPSLTGGINFTDEEVSKLFDQFWDNQFSSGEPAIAVWKLRKNETWRRSWPGNWSTFCESVLGISVRVANRLADETEYGWWYHNTQGKPTSANIFGVEMCNAS